MPKSHISSRVHKVNADGAGRRRLTAVRPVSQTCLQVCPGGVSARGAGAKQSSIFIFGETLLKRESAAEQSVCGESAEAIVPPYRTTPAGRAESGVGNHSNL